MKKYMAVMVDRKTLKHIQSYPMTENTDYSTVEALVDNCNSMLPINAKTEFAIVDYEPSNKPHTIKFEKVHCHS